MDDSTRYEVQSADWVGNAIVVAVLAVACLVYAFFASSSDRWFMLGGGAFFLAVSLVSLSQGRVAGRWCIEVSSAGLSQCGTGQLLEWGDMSGLRIRGDRVDVLGRHGDPAIRLYHQLEHFEDALNRIVRMRPGPVNPPRIHERPRRPTRSPMFLLLLSIAALLALWLWNSADNIVGFVLPAIVLGIFVSLERNEIAAVQLDGDALTVVRAGREDVYAWRDVSDVRFRLRYVGKGNHVVELLVHTERGDVKLAVPGTNLFELYNSLKVFRAGEAT